MLYTYPGLFISVSFTSKKSKMNGSSEIFGGSRTNVCTKRIKLTVNLNHSTMTHSAVEVNLLLSLLSNSPNVTSPKQFFA